MTPEEEAAVLRRLEGLERGNHELTAWLHELAGRLEQAERRREEEDPAVTAAKRAVTARPWTEGEPFRLARHPVAGTVLACGGQEAPGAGPYRAFEDVFRGSRDRVRGLLERYVELLRGQGPVLDVGAGRGELLELLREAGVEARGVDVDAGMAQGAAAAGLDVTLADGVAHLEALEAGSLGAVSAMHVVEHLSYEQLLRFLRAARRALRDDGLLVFETVNPHAPFALKMFWLDPTHRHPLIPEAMLVLARSAGFAEAFLTHLRGTGDVEVDWLLEDSYTIVASPSAGLLP